MEGQFAQDGGGLGASRDVGGPDVAFAAGDASKTGCLGWLSQMSRSLCHPELRILGI